MKKISIVFCALLFALGVNAQTIDVTGINVETETEIKKYEPLPVVDEMPFRVGFDMLIGSVSFESPGMGFRMNMFQRHGGYMDLALSFDDELSLKFGYIFSPAKFFQLYAGMGPSFILVRNDRNKESSETFLAFDAGVMFTTRIGLQFFLGATSAPGLKSYNEQSVSPTFGFGYAFSL